MAEKKPNIVVIDDSAASISLYRRSTESLNVELNVFQTPADSLEYLASNPADLIFTGIIMRGTDGWSILKKMRKWDHHKDTTTIVVTSKNYAQDRTMAEQLGVREFLVKPLRSQEIREIICKYTGAEVEQT
ncbi:MAG: response regulator [Gammaproteobacteria bacterium]|nr:response regulator [Gammaproteobacteria bacterium]